MYSRKKKEMCFPFDSEKQHVSLYESTIKGLSLSLANKRVLSYIHDAYIFKININNKCFI